MIRSCSSRYRNPHSSALCLVQPCVLLRQHWARHPNLKNFANKSLLLPSFLPFSLPHTVPLSLFAATVCLLFHPSIEHADKYRSKFSLIQPLASQPGSRDARRAGVSVCLWFHVLGCDEMCVWRTIMCAHLSGYFCVILFSFNLFFTLPLLLPFFSRLHPSFHLPPAPVRTLYFCLPPPPLPPAVRRSVQCRAVRGAEDRGFMVFSPEEHLIQGQRVTFNWRMESLFPVM